MASLGCTSRLHHVLYKIYPLCIAAILECTAHSRYGRQKPTKDYTARASLHMLHSVQTGDNFNTSGIH